MVLLWSRGDKSSWSCLSGAIQNHCDQISWRELEGKGCERRSVRQRHRPDMTRLDLAAFRTHTHSKAASCRRLRRHESPVHGTAVQFHSTNDAGDSGLQRPSGSVLCPTTPAVHQGNRRHYFIFLAVEPPFDMGCEQLGGLDPRQGLLRVWYVPVPSDARWRVGARAS